MLSNGSYARTNLVPTFRNFKNWKEIIKYGKGTIVDNIELKGDILIDADSKPRIILKPLKQESLL